MTCKDCKNYQKTNLEYFDIKDVNFEHPFPLYDCPYASDWCEEDYEINTLCDNMFEPKEDD